MGISEAQYLDLLKSPTMPNQDQQIPQHPAWIVRVRRRVRESNEAIFWVNILEEALLELL
jgi:hypothetical protein